MNRLSHDPVTASAYSQARYAFIELNQKAVVDTLYANEDYQRYWGYRLLAVDGSKIQLPDNDEMREEVGTLNYTNGKDKELQGEHLMHWLLFYSLFGGILWYCTTNAQRGRREQSNRHIDTLRKTKAFDSPIGVVSI